MNFPNPTEEYILYAEDNQADYLFFKRAYERQALDHRLIYRQDGNQVRDFLLRQVGDDARLPRLIILDIKMPGLSGLDVLEFIRQHPELRYLPVVLLSASGEQRDLQRAYANRVNGYLIKPERYRELQEMVEAVMGFWLRFNRVLV